MTYPILFDLLGIPQFHSVKVHVSTCTMSAISEIRHFKIKKIQYHIIIILSKLIIFSSIKHHCTWPKCQRSILTRPWKTLHCILVSFAIKINCLENTKIFYRTAVKVKGKDRGFGGGLYRVAMFSASANTTWHNTHVQQNTTRLICK